jgi:hypothetical protein
VTGVAAREGNRVIRDGTLVCDSCQKPITKITQVPEGGWPQMHNLCTPCFESLWKTALQRA